MLPFLDRPTSGTGLPELQRRGGLVVIVLGCAFFLLLGRLCQLQIVRGDRYYRRSTDNFVKREPLRAVRGLVKDRSGVVLADNRPAYDVLVTPRHFTPAARERLARLLALAPSEQDELDARLARARDPARRGHDLGRSVVGIPDVDRDRMALVRQAGAELPGVEVRDVSRRTYPYATLAAHALGYLNRVNARDLEQHAGEGYDDEDFIGRSGVERQWESYLRGKKGHEVYVVDARGRRKSDEAAESLLGGERSVAPSPGHDVVLTLDVELQRLAERAMRKHPAGAVAIVDVTNGKVLALVSKPGFEPNIMTGGLSRVEEEALESDPYKPFVDRALQLTYFPGSTYKVVTALAGLASGAVDMDDEILCRGWHELGRHTFRCGKAHGKVQLAEALTQSCNIYFWEVAVRVGMDRIGETARDLGFGAPTGLGLNGDAAGRVPWRAAYEKAGFRIGHTLNTSIGQGDTEVTVLQLALAYAAIANGGQLWVPQFIERIETADGRIVSEPRPELRRRIAATDAALAELRRGMWGVVNDPRGTAFGVRVDGTTLAGKTGTAQVRKLQAQPDASWHPHRDHAWFAGWAPADEPRVAIVVLVEHGGKGGHVAAPIAAEIATGAAELGAIGGGGGVVAVGVDPTAEGPLAVDDGPVAVDDEPVREDGDDDLAAADDGAADAGAADAGAADAGAAGAVAAPDEGAADAGPLSDGGTP